jgi:uncharacterized protein YjbI with pentapeptide repeats
MAQGNEIHAVKLLDSVNEASRAVAARYAAFLTAVAFIGVSVATTTDEMLVRDSSLVLPLLNAPIPISGYFSFYTVVPCLVFLLHAGLLLQFSLLAEKVWRFEAEAANLNEDQAARLHGHLAQFYFVHFLAGREIAGIRRWILGLGIWTSLMAVPMLLLLWIQVRYLSYHDPTTTWIHRGAIVADGILLVWFGWRILWRSTTEKLALAGPEAHRLRLWQPVLGLLAWMFVLASGMAFSLFVAKIPEAGTGPSASIADQDKLIGRWLKLRNLDLREKILTANQPLAATVINDLREGDIEEKEKALKQVVGLNLQHRDLHSAMLFNAVLPKADFRALRNPDGKILSVTSLEGAYLVLAQMQHALLDDARMQWANLSDAQLQWASLKNTELQNAELNRAALQCSDLTGANLRNAHLEDAHLEGANLSGADLQGANLQGARLQGALLRKTRLQGAILAMADLQGADLSEARLQDADLSWAKLQGAILHKAFLGGTRFDEADLAWADVRSINLDPPAHGRKDTLDKARSDSEPSWWCNDERPFKQCAGQADVDRYRNALDIHLAKLACTDFFVAEGMVKQVRHMIELEPDAYPTRKTLAKTLLEADRSEAECRGIKALPSKAKQTLRYFYSPAGNE